VADAPTYRRLRRDESDAAARIHRLGMALVPCFDETLHTPEDDRAFYRGRVFAECEILGAFAGADLLGHVAWRSGWIDHLYVDPAHHRRGIGSRLVDLVKTQRRSPAVDVSGQSTGAPLLRAARLRRRGVWRRVRQRGGRARRPLPMARRPPRIRS